MSYQTKKEEYEKFFDELIDNGDSPSVEGLGIWNVAHTEDRQLHFLIYSDNNYIYDTLNHTKPSKKQIKQWLRKFFKSNYGE